jgi:GNAT superfamily N-acetyltransferase
MHPRASKSATCDHDLRADPYIVEAWANGWALSRGTPAPVRCTGAFRIDVGLPQHKARYIFPQCSADIPSLAETIHDPDVFIKVCAPPALVQSLLPSHWTIATLGFMMTQRSPRDQDAPMPATYTLGLTFTPPILIAQVIDSNGLIAAKGRVALVGPFAIYDQIETHEHHRRRGLGSVVMHALRKSASNHGVDHGLLVATADGRGLYTALGWQMHSLFTTAAIPREPILSSCVHPAMNAERAYCALGSDP